ncbi:MAG: mechanosensitive ion channel [Methyloprofundus sp.]|nr:mechanosensitive ion channel [Methyloprofundus sp.]
MIRISLLKARPIYGYALQLVFIFMLMLAAPAFSQDQTVDAPTVKQMLKADTIAEIEDDVPRTKAPYDRLNRGTPRSSVMSLAAAIKQGDHKHLMDFMDMRQVPRHIADQGPELIRKLKIIADRIFWMGPENLSIEPTGHLDDGLPSYRDRVATINTPEGPVDILMQRVPGDKKGVYIWKISNQTVMDIPRLYELYGYGELGDRLSKVFPEFKGLVLQPWQLVILIGIVLFSYCIAWFLTWMTILLLKRGKSPRADRLQEFFKGPVRFMILVVIFRNYFYLIAPSLKVNALFEAKSLYIVAFSWLLIGVVNLFISRLVDRMEQGGNIHGSLMLRPAARAGKVIVILIAIMVWLDNMGFSISTLLAGLGVGSIAIALAAQKSIENLIGAITLYSAQPIRVGEFCRVGNAVGTIEEIGLRATQLRTLDHTLINIPNGSLANMEIENISQRQKILYRHKIRLRADSTPEQLREVLKSIRQLLDTHSRIDPVPARVRFKEFGEYSLDLEVFAYLNTMDYNEYLEIAEDLNIQIIDVIAQAGTSIAVPVQYEVGA